VAYATVGTSWKDGANETEINAARQVVIQDMKILEGIAPDSGAYLNEVGVTSQVRPRPFQRVFSLFVSGFQI
jgi:hypothetical protein